MGLGSATERLQFLIGVDAEGAIRAFQQVGQAADENLGQVDNRLNRLGGGMQIAGAGMVAFAVTAGAGLMSLAASAEESNLAQVQLQNTIGKMPELAGANIDAFNELAEAIQSKTVADGDAVVAGMAMLGTFHLTQDEILALTPLVVDYSRKFGVDLNTAFVSVGKAMDGQIGILKKQGVTIDEAAFKTDKLGAVMAALRENAGGFAEEEGKTFAGQIEILKNSLGDLGEGVGVGVVQAMSGMTAKLQDLMGVLGGVSDESLAAGGRIATYGVAVIGAAGGASFLIGSLIKMKSNFTALGTGVSSAVQGLGGWKNATVAAGVAAGVAGLALFALQQNMSDNAKRAAQHKAAIDSWTGAIQEFGDTAAAAQNQIATVFAGSDIPEAMDAMGLSAEQLSEDLLANADAWSEIDASSAMMGGWRRGLEELADAGDESAQAILAGVEAGNLSEDQAARMAIELGTLAREHDEAADAVKDKASADTEAKTKAEEATVAQEAETQALEDQRQKAREAADALNALVDANNGYVGITVSVLEANARVEEGQRKLNELVAQGKGGTAEYSAAVLNQIGNINGAAQAAANYAVNQAALGGVTISAAEKNVIYRNELSRLRDTTAPGSPLRGALDGMIAQLNNAAAGRTININTSAAIANLNALIAKAKESTGLLGKTLGAFGHASGGTLAAGRRSVINEGGGAREVIQLGEAAHVYPSSRANSLAGRQVTTVVVQLDGKTIAEAIAPHQRGLARSVH